jgi:AAA15 family ATPase/GTPase
MLLRFAVSNFRSIRDEQELSLVASQAIKDDPQALIETPALRKDKVLPAALIYGANASGKSNVVEALRFMQRMVLDSHTDLKPGAPFGRPPFRLAPGWPEKESRFDLTFVHEGVRYQYGFTAFEDRFGSEWLYSWPSGSRRELFVREGQEFSFGRFLKGDNQLIARNTKANSLFVSAAAQNNHEQLSIIYYFFMELWFERLSSLNVRNLAFFLGDTGLDSRILKFLCALDTGVTRLRIIEEDHHETMGDLFSKRDISNTNVKPKNFLVHIFEPKESMVPSDNVRDLGSNEKIGKLAALFNPMRRKKRAQLGHATKDGGVEFFDLDDESTGTIRMLSFLEPIFNALDTGATVVIDELDSSLHTHACEQVIALFQSPKTNPKGAQLIATTHDTNLLKSEMLRRDQVWFTEKDDEGATHLYPLTDIHTRKGDNIEKGYLQGRFGAVPFAGSVDDFIKMD